MLYLFLDNNNAVWNGGGDGAIVKKERKSITVIPKDFFLSFLRIFFAKHTHREHSTHFFTEEPHTNIYCGVFEAFGFCFIRQRAQ